MIWPGEFMKKYLTKGVCSAAVIAGIAIGLPERQQLRISNDGLYMLAELEGCRNVGYLCAANVATNGLGHTKTAKLGEFINDTAMAANYLDDVKDAENAVNRCIRVELSQGQFDAFTSFAFNVGQKQFCNSTLARKANGYDRRGACYELERWVYVNGKPLPGLVKRREVELTRCLQ